MCWTKGPQQSMGPCCSFLMKGGAWKGSLFIACSAPQASLRRHAAGGLHRATTLKKPILKHSQSQTLTLETGTRLHTSGSTFYSPSFFLFFHACPSKRLESSVCESKFTRGPCLNPLHACEGLVSNTLACYGREIFTHYGTLP